MPWLILALPLMVIAGIGTYLSMMRWRYAAYHRHIGRPMPSSGLRGFWVQVRELMALCVVGWWHVVGLFAEGRHVPDGPVRGHPVFGVHGFGQNHSNWVGITPKLLARGRIVETVSMGRPFRSQDAYADRLAERLRSLVEDHGPTVDVMCHSMGGIVLRRVLQRHPDLAEAMGRIVTVASPHAGTAAARGLRRLPETAAMHRRGAWLGDLPSLVELAPQAKVTAIGSPDDTTVYPIETTAIDGARNLVVEGLGHGGLMVYWEGEAFVLEALER